MLKKLLSDFASYNLWANTGLIEMVKVAGEVKATQTIKSSFPSIYKTILHIWDAQYLWLHRMQHDHFPEAPSKSFDGITNELLDNLKSSSQHFSNFVNGMKKEELSNTLTYKNSKGIQFTSPFSETILHCLNHSTFHRGQVITMLRQLGEENLIQTDYVAYCRLK